MTGRRWRAALVGAAIALVLAGCQWSMPRFDASGSGYNPNEDAITTDALADLEVARTATVPGSSTSVPVVAGSTAYVTTAGGGLRAFPLWGSAGCSGSPAACQPLWRAADGATAGQAVVAGGTVFVPVGADLHAYDAAGVQGCGGSPKVCQPRWTAPGWAGSMVVSEGRLFVSGQALGAFDVNGVAGCAGTPKVCSPVTTYVISYDTGISPPVVADGVLYVGVGYDTTLLNGGQYGAIGAYDAHGIVGCTGAPVVCQARWGATTGRVNRSPAVVDGVVYVASSSRVEDEEGTQISETRVDGFPAASCWADPGHCFAPAWRVKVSETFSSPSIAVANGLLHVTGPDGTTWTYPTGSGSPCGGGYPCEPLRRSVGTGSPAVTDHLLYVGKNAFDVSGVAGCTGSPTTCQPLWSGAGVSGTAIPTNGLVLDWATDGLGNRVLTVYHRT